MKEYLFCLEFVYDNLLNLVRHATPELAPKPLPTVPPYLGGQGGSNSVRGPQLCAEQSREISDSFGSSDEVSEVSPSNYEDHIAQTVERTTRM